MANDLWILVGFGPVLCAGSAVAFAEGRRALENRGEGSIRTARH